MTALSLTAFVPASRRMGRASLLPLLTATVLVAGCADNRGGTGSAGGQQPAKPAPAPPIEFTSEDEFKYTFTATGAGLSPTGDPDRPQDAASPGLTYLVVSGTLANKQTDRPVPAYPGSNSIADPPSGIGVTIPRAALDAAIPPDKTPLGRGTCLKLTAIGRYGLQAKDIDGGRCLLLLDLSTPSGGSDATIPAAGSVHSVYQHVLPEKLPLDQIQLVGYHRNDDRAYDDPGSPYKATSSYPVPWNPS